VCSFFAVEEMNLPSACMLLQDYLRLIQDVIMREIGPARGGGACHFEHQVAVLFERFVAQPAPVLPG
jgi:hypothetical protein